MAACQPTTIAVPHIISVFEKQMHVFKNVGIVAYKSLAFCGPQLWLVANSTMWY